MATSTGPGWRAHVRRTADCGTDAGSQYGHRFRKLDQRKRAADGVTGDGLRLWLGAQFVAGAFVADKPGDAFDADAYLRQVAGIQSHGGTPVIFQSYGLTQQM